MSYGAITDVPNNLKLKYPPRAVKTMINEKRVFRPRLSKDLPSGATITSGYEMRFGARLAAEQNVAQITDGGNFPIPKTFDQQQFVFKPSIFAGAYNISLLSRYLANDKATTFTPETRRKPEEVMKNMGKLIESTYVGTDGTGIRGYVESDGASSTFVVAYPHGVRLLPKNAYISVRQSAAGSIRDSVDLRQITGRASNTRTITYSGADQTLVADDPIYIVPETAIAGATLGTVHANGLRGQVDNGSLAQYLHTLDRTAAGNDELKSIVLDAGGDRRNLTEQLLLNAHHDCFEATDGAVPSTLIMGVGQVEKFVEFVSSQKRYPAMGRQRAGKTLGYKKEDLVFSTPTGDMDFEISTDCMPGEIYGVSWESFFLYSALDAQWLSGHEMDNLIMLPGSNGSSHRSAWGAYLVSIENWGTDYPLSHFKILDLKDRNLGD